MQKQIEGRRAGFRTAVSKVLRGVRRAMPRVAIAAAVLFVVWLLARDTRIYEESFVGSLLGFFTLLAVLATSAYYGFKGLRWVKRKLLWRVRRRLVITYLFVGLTPIILLILLGLLSAFGGSGQGIARIVTAQVKTTEKQAGLSAETLADALSHLPPGMDDRSLQAWLDERVAYLRASLPGVRAALWRGAAGEDGASVGLFAPAQLVSDIDEEKLRGIGNDPLPAGAPLPEWLRGQRRWSGLAFTGAIDSQNKFGAPSLRAVVRGASGTRPFALLLIVPLSRALVEHYRELTGVQIRPFFVSSNISSENDAVRVRFRDESERRSNAGMARPGSAAPSARALEEMFRYDQLGEPLEEGVNYPVVLPATAWASGETTQHLSFLFGWSFSLAKKQFFGAGQAGEVWRQALWIVAIAFLVLELLALIAGTWMTRAVTGTVHKLYRGVEFIKRGDFSHRVRVRSHDQLGELAVAFNDMSANIEALLQERVKHERLEREVEIAAEVQAQLFPHSIPALSTVEIAAGCRAARGVAGDYYDYIEVAAGLVALALGDVSGKGLSASLVMSNLQATLRAQATITAERLNIAERAAVASAEMSGSGGSKLLAHVFAAAEIDGAVSRKVANINQQLCQSTEANRFATLFLGIYEDRTRVLRYTNAGHNPPLLVRADGKIERLTTGGLMTGAFDWACYEEAAVTLQAGDLLLIFSDGISEAENEDDEEYGEQRLAQFAVEHRRLPADQLRAAIFDEIDAWSGQRERNDDQTLVIVKGK
ncbi:MAG TPA: SpoIIE family protein phosphatase [Pyrinomonadaceae bacterium]